MAVQGSKSARFCSERELLPSLPQPLMRGNHELVEFIASRL